MVEDVVRLEGVSKRYGREVVALESVSLSIARGEWVSVTGPSGSGKSTLLNLLGLLDAPTEGELWIAGRRASVLDERGRTRLRRETIGLVFQRAHLLPYLSALENVMVAQHYHSLAEPGEARAMLAAVGLSRRADHRPSELSGGEQQRVCIARALVNRPSLLLADEPTGSLDARSKEGVVRLLRELHSGGQTLVVATHDSDLSRLAARGFRLEDGRLAR